MKLKYIIFTILCASTLLQCNCNEIYSIKQRPISPQPQEPKSAESKEITITTLETTTLPNGDKVEKKQITFSYDLRESNGRLGPAFVVANQNEIPTNESQKYSATFEFDDYKSQDPRLEYLYKIKTLDKFFKELAIFGTKQSSLSTPFSTGNWYAKSENQFFSVRNRVFQDYAEMRHGMPPIFVGYLKNYLRDMPLEEVITYIAQLNFPMPTSELNFPKISAPIAEPSSLDLTQQSIDLSNSGNIASLKKALNAIKSDTSQSQIFNYTNYSGTDTKLDEYYKRQALDKFFIELSDFNPESEQLNYWNDAGNIYPALQYKETNIAIVEMAQGAPAAFIEYFLNKYQGKPIKDMIIELMNLDLKKLKDDGLPAYP